MARRIQEEDNHWPGFVDALSTIVMVVTFLLIILVVVIVVISQQVTPEEGVAREIQVAELEADLVEVTAQLVEQTEAVEEREKVIEEITQSVEQQTETIVEQELTIQELNELSTQIAVVDGGDTPQVQAEIPIVETEIIVPRVDENVVSQDLRTDVETAQAVMTVVFEDNTIELDEPSRVKASEFIVENAVVSLEQQIVAMSYYDADSVSVSQAKRTAYYRLLSVRNALLDSGVEGGNISASVEAATINSDGTSNVNRVKVFLR